MPMVPDMVERLTGRRPISHGNPELLVTRGAAYHAHLLSGEPVAHRKGPIGMKKSDMTSVLHSGIGVQTVVLNAAGDDIDYDSVAGGHVCGWRAMGQPGALLRGHSSAIVTSEEGAG